LKNRLELIQYYKTVHGDHAFWPHFFMRRVANHALKYKFNYAVKGFAAYLVYRDFANYQHMKETSFLTMQDESKQVAKIMAQSAVFFGICCMI
jgi:hypothetical protein